MAFALNEYVATASQTDFIIGWSYLADVDVVVEVDGVSKTLTTDYTLPSASTIRFNSGLSVGDLVLIFRSTNRLGRLVDYTAPSTLDEDDLDNDSLQAFFMAQEAMDAAGRKLDLHDAGEDISGFNGFYLTINEAGLPAPGVTALTLSLTYTDQQFSGDGSEKNFTLSVAPNGVVVTEVFITGVRQVPTIDYSVAAKVLTFVSAPPNGSSNIYVRHGSSSAVVGADVTATGSTTERSLPNRFADYVNVLDYGAKGDGATDDAAAFQAAVDTFSTLGGTVYIPKGVYILGTTIKPIIEMFNLAFIGDGESTILRASHSAGAVLHLNRTNWRVENLKIEATTGRNSGGAGANYGILIEAPDTAGKAVAKGLMRSVEIEEQPNHGLLVVGDCQLSVFQQVLLDTNKGHGMVFDRGQTTSRTNKTDPLLVTLQNCWALFNTGHGLVLGHPSDAAGSGSVRFHIENGEFASNAQSAGVRHTVDQVWVRGENTVFQTCAFGGASETTGGIFISGTENYLLNCRYIDVTTAVTIGEDVVLNLTRGTTIDGMRVITSTALNPAVVINTLATTTDIRVRAGFTGNVTTLITTGAVRATAELTSPVTRRVLKQTDQTVSNSNTLVADTVLKIPLAATETVSFKAHIRHVGNSTADIKIGFTGSASAAIRWGPANSILLGAGDTISILSERTESTVMDCGAETTTRWIDIVGRVLVGATAGDLQLKFAQTTATVVDTKVLAGSWLEVVDGNVGI